MIKNIFYVLSIALCGAATYFGYTTKGKLTGIIEETHERYSDNTGVLSNLDKKQGELDGATTERKTAEEARDEADATLANESSKESGLKSTLGKLEADIEGYDAEIEEIETALSEARSVIGGLVPDAGNDLDVDVVVAHIESLENDLKEKEADLEEKEEIAGKLAQAVGNASGRKENLQDRLGRVKNRIALNGVSASVSAVNTDYGFCIISRGANNSNIDERSKLIVSRGGKVVGRLKVAQVEPTQTICDIVQTSLKPGQRIRSGDRVTIEVPAAN